MTNKEKGTKENNDRQVKFPKTKGQGDERTVSQSQLSAVDTSSVGTDSSCSDADQEVKKKVVYVRKKVLLDDKGRNVK